MAKENTGKRQKLKENSPKTIALIVAGGSGSRLGGDVPKQYLPLAGKPLILHTITRFLKHPGIDAVQVVARKEDKRLYEQAVKGLDLLPVAYGGKNRQQSVANGLGNIKKYNPGYVLIHDAARPFVSSAMITDIIAALRRNPAVTPALDMVDTVKESGRTIDKSGMVRVQTPQGFHFPEILEMHRKAAVRDFPDDVSLYEERGIKVKYVKGSNMNFKITTKDDYDMASNLAATAGFVRVGTGFDVHAFAPLRNKKNKIRICGIPVPHEQKLEGHSDADVGLHAIVDALLGAIGAGDIGEHFPPSEKKWKSADSAIFIEYTKKLLDKKNVQIFNIDVTVICERPHLKNYKKQMASRVADLLEISAEQVNIKATTTERLGFTGRGEGIAAQAIASVREWRY